MKLHRVSITGPESTGKSLLASQLAAHFGTIYVPEIARQYLNKLGRPYAFEDIVLIAQQQLETENRMAEIASGILFCDTDLLVTRIWSLYKYGKCDPWIEEKVKNHHYDLFLLCNIDLPWEEDPLREHPDRRLELFDIYMKELEAMNADYRIISGFGDERLERAISAVEETLRI